MKKRTDRYGQDNINKINIWYKKYKLNFKTFALGPYVSQVYIMTHFLV